MSNNGDDTPGKHRGALKPAWQPGQSGNPAGRPKGSRVKLADKYTADLLAEWERRGIVVLKELSAVDLVRAVGVVMPKEHNVRVGDLDELTDEQLATQLAAGLAALAAAGLSVGERTDAPSTAKSLN